MLFPTGGGVATESHPYYNAAMERRFDVAIVGAGVFGAWIAYHLAAEGASVALIDAFGPANSRASSGGESRIIRLGYGRDELYTRSAQRSLALWHKVFDAQQEYSGLLKITGVLWLAHEYDDYCNSTLTTLRSVGARCEQLDQSDLAYRYPQLNLIHIAWGILEPDSGVLLARRAVKAIVSEAVAKGAVYLQEACLPPTQGKLTSVTASSSKKVFADRFVFACGPWLPKLFPQTLDSLIHVTKQEVFFFGVPAGDESFSPERLPAWIDFRDLVYGLPDLEHRGFKIAIDAHGPAFDPDTGDRVVSPEGLKAARAYLRQRLPTLSNAPVAETRVCQYENTWNGDFLIDRHPECENAWLVGGGSGHGFKHGPAVGEYVVRMIQGRGRQEPRFSLDSKEETRNRSVF